MITQPYNNACSTNLFYALGKHHDVVLNQKGSFDQRVHSKCNHVEDNGAMNYSYACFNHSSQIGC